MSLVRTPILASFFVIAAATVARAQPAQTVPPAPIPPAPPATTSRPPPAGGDGSDVSQINGQLVPVGDHNQYYYRVRKTNISTNPVGWILGSYGVSVSQALGQNVAIRGDVNFYSPPDTSINGFELGIGVPIYFRRAYQGLFLEPGLITRTFSSDHGSDNSTTLGPQVLVGWHWMWDSGLNFAIAGGVGRNWSTDDEYEEPVFPNGYMRFGYAF